MGRYSFIEDAGAKLPEIGQKGAHTARKSEKPEEKSAASPNPEASERLEGRIHEFGLKVEDLSLMLEGERVHLKGKVSRQEVREKIILLVGNTQGVAEVQEELQVDQAGPEAHFYTVAPDDSLEGIAERLLGSEDKSGEILEANRPLIKDKAEIFPGLVLRVPSFKGSS